MSTQSLTGAEAIASFINIEQQAHKNGDFVAAEKNYLQAISTAETVYGAYHGEVAVVLMKLVDLYRRFGYYEEAVCVEERIAEIAAIYLEDQRWCSV